MKHGRGWARRFAVVAVIAAATTLAGSTTQVGAFAPTNFKGLGSNTHQSITEDSVNALDREFFSVSRLTRTMTRALKDITDANAAVDGDQVHSAFHFDGENFAGGQARVLDLYNR